MRPGWIARIKTLWMEPRTAGEVLAWSRGLVNPVLREAVDTLPGAVRRIAGYQLGWWEADGRTVLDTGEHPGAIPAALTLLAAEATGADPVEARPGAVAVELVHQFSLIHDGMIGGGQEDRPRRPAVSSVFGPGRAIVTGDALIALAVGVLSRCGHPSAPDAVRMLNSAVRSLVEDGEPQRSFRDHPDLGVVDRLEVAEARSGALLGCACAIGGQFAGATPPQVAGLYGFGVRLGVAVEIVNHRPEPHGCPQLVQELLAGALAQLGTAVGEQRATMELSELGRLIAGGDRR